MLHVCFINDMTYSEIALLVPPVIPDASAKRRHRALEWNPGIPCPPPSILSTPLSILFCYRAIPTIPLSPSQSSSISEYCGSCAWLLFLGPLSYHYHSLDPFSFPCVNELQPRLLLISQPTTGQVTPCPSLQHFSSP
jgi:hypothetical protein